jgi:hypothetical protein
MRSVLRRKPRSADLAAVARDAESAYRRARDHWSSCDQCRGAARASAATWCEVGLGLMSQGNVSDPHWDACPRCRQAQEGVRRLQCETGRSLDEAYRAASQRLAAAAGG